MDGFLQNWAKAALTSTGFFWMALWAFALGYLISSLIQVLVTQTRMQRLMGKEGPRSMLLGTAFGFISSSCSFAALSTTRALFQKGAGLAPAMAFLLASTNLVIELGIVIALFLSWHFVVAEYVGGLLLIGFAWLFIKITRPRRLVERVRDRLGGDEQQDGHAVRSAWDKLQSRDGWQAIGQSYVMEWQMVWKDVLIGFTIAGIIAAFVPDAFFETLFVGAGSGSEPGFGAVLAQTLIGPFAAFATFIGSMGNIPLAALLYERGVSFAGVMAFIFSDLVVLPVLRINAQYYGWKMALYILVMLLSGLVVVSLAMHYGLMALDLLPQGQSGGGSGGGQQRDLFKLNYGFVLNLIFLAVSAALGWLWWSGKQRGGGHAHHHDHGGSSRSEQILKVCAAIAAAWLLGGLGAAALPGVQASTGG